MLPDPKCKNEITASFVSYSNISFRTLATQATENRHKHDDPRWSNVKMRKISESTQIPNWSSSKTNECNFKRVQLKLLCLEVCKTSLAEGLEVQTACVQLAVLETSCSRKQGFTTGLTTAHLCILGVWWVSLRFNLSYLIYLNLNPTVQLKKIEDLRIWCCDLRNRSISWKKHGLPSIANTWFIVFEGNLQDLTLAPLFDRKLVSLHVHDEARKLNVKQSCELVSLKALVVEFPSHKCGSIGGKCQNRLWNDDSENESWTRPSRMYDINSVTLAAIQDCQLSSPKTFDSHLHYLEWGTQVRRLSKLVNSSCLASVSSVYAEFEESVFLVRPGLEVIRKPLGSGTAHQANVSTL